MDFDFDENINPFNVDLYNLEREYFARDIPIEDQRERSIQLDTNLQEIFPEADEVLYENEETRIREQFYPFTGQVGKETIYPWFKNKNKIPKQTDNEEIPAEL